MSQYRVAFSFSLCSILFWAFSLCGFAQTINFNELTEADGHTFPNQNPYVNNGVSFELTQVTNPAARIQVSSVGAGGSKAIRISAFNEEDVKGWKIKKQDGSAFQFTSIWLQENFMGGSSTAGTIKAFKNNIQIGAPAAVNFDSRTGGAKSFASNPDFYDVDEILIEAPDLYIILDDFTYGPPISIADGDPPVVTGINLAGSPPSTATSVDFAVTFSKPAQNVTVSDFQLTTVGTTGTIASVSVVSSTNYTVTVNGIAGEGTIRLDLKAGTDIANEDGTMGTPAYTGGQLHYVGSCYTESFETKPDGATSFSSNGRVFTLGTGLEVESRSGFGAGDPPSSRYIKNNFNPGTFTITADDKFTIGSIDLFLSDQSNDYQPTATGSLIIVGRLNGTDQFTITKNTGFPTTTTNGNNGFFTVNFATEGGINNSNVNIDELVFTIGGGFKELDIDNFNFCEAIPDVDNQAPAIQSLKLVGTPESTVGAVAFQAVFNEIAQNVTLDDFSVHATGTATGTLTGITGSGTTYTLQVTGISGEGTIQVRLNSGTDIEDVLGNATPIEYVNGQVHYVGACYVETFEAFAGGVTDFVSNGKNFSLTGNWGIHRQISFGFNASDVFLLNTGTGPYTLNASDVPVAFSQLALYLSSDAGGATPTSDGTLTIRGKSGGSTVYTITKDTGFPTDFGTTHGFFFVDFTTDGEGDYSSVFVDALEIELGGAFAYLALDNLGFCSDFEAPSGYTVTIDQDPITPTNETAVGFTFAGAEVGATYHYTFSSDGGGTDVTDTGTITSATQQLTDIDLSGLSPGAVTLTVTLTDPSGNTGTAVTDEAGKIINYPPNGIDLDNSSINQSAGTNAAVGTLSTTDPDVGDTHIYSLVTGTGDDDNDDFNISGASLQANDASGFAAGTYSVLIQTEDQYGATYIKAFAITVVDDIAPAISSVAVPANGTYGTGQDLDFTVNVTEAVTVNDGGGTPTLPVTLNSGSIAADYVSGSSTSALVFRYTVQSGDVDTDGISVSGGLSLNGAAITDGAANNMNLILNAVGNTTGVLVDGIAPTVTNVDVPADGTHGIGVPLQFTVRFNEPVTVNTTGGTPRIELTIGTTIQYATYLSGSGTDELVFQYTVQLDDPESSVAVGTVVDLNGGTITDLPGNTAVTTLNGIGSTANVRVDGVRPTAEIDIADTDLIASETTTVTITFSEAVTGFDNNDVIARNGSLSTFSSNDGGITWTATFTPTGGMIDATNVMTLDNTGVTDQAGNAGTGTTLSANYTIDTERPTATIIISNINLHACATATVTVTFTKAVSGFDNADLTIPYGTLTDMTSTDGGITWTATFTPNPNVQETGLQIILDNTGVVDDSGNAGLGTTSSNAFDINSMELVLTSGGQTNVSCYGGSNGTATVDASGGVGPYMYSWAPSGGTGSTATGLPAGNYTVTVTDANLCQATLDFTITEPTALSISPSQTNVTCFTEADGTATVAVSGGTGPYAYSWNTVPIQTTATATNLPAGNYTVVVTDNNACTISQNFTITEPNEITASMSSITPASTYGGNDGSATVSATGGTGALSYSWSTTPHQTGVTATGLVAGTYTVTITDENNCFKTLDVTITEPQPPIFTNLDGDVVTFIEDGPAVLLDAGGDATVSDSDSPDFNGGNLTVSIVANGAPGEDGLAIRDEGFAAGEIGVSGDDVYYGGTPIGQLTGGTGGIGLVVTFLPTSTPAAAQALVRNLTYGNFNTADPSPDPRTIHVTLYDGDGATSAFQEVTVNITLVNDAPVLTTSGGTVTFTEPEDGDPEPVTIDPGLTVTDPDNATLASATVHITGSFESGEDLLAFVNDGSMDNISGSYDAGTGILTLTSAGATATRAEWEAALRAVTYSNSSHDPSTAVRTISFVANDGTTDSSPATRDINIVAVNTAPVAMDDEIPVTEDIPATGNALTNDSDVEGNALTASLTIAPVNGTVVLNADGSLTYTPNSNYNGLDSLQYQACDNGMPTRCDTAWVYFNVEAVNDAPTITAPATLAADEDIRTPLTGISFADVDAGGADVMVTVEVASGTLSATSGGGVIVSGSETETLTLVGSITDLNAFIAADALHFTTALHATSDVTLTVTIDDDGNTGSDPGSSGTDDSEAATATITLVVTALNDAPVNTVPVSQTVDQNGSLVFSPSNGNAISVSDVDAGGGTIRVSLAATNGLLTLSGITGLNFLAGDGTDDVTVTFDGTLADINQALNGLLFVPTSGYNGLASLQITTDDLGLTGSDGPKTDTDLINITVNPIEPVVTAVGSATPDGLYKIGDVISLTVTFDQSVMVDEAGGSPGLLMETGDTDREAAYTLGSGSNTLTFNYTVQASDVSADLDYTSTAALVLNGATIQSASGNDAVLDLPILGANSIAGQHDLVIDGVAPDVTSVDVPANGYYREGDVLRFTVHMDDDVTVNDAGGTPYLEVTVGTTDVEANYTGGSGTAMLTFGYTVQAEDEDLDGIALGSDIVLSGGTLHDNAGNEAMLILNGVAPTDHVFVDSRRPSVALSTEAATPVNAPFTVMATFSEAVTGFTLADVTVPNGTLSDLETSDNIVYTFQVTPAEGGNVELFIAADVVVNIADNGNDASNILNIQFNEIITGIVLKDSSFVYDGTAKALEVEGALPEGVTVEYADNSRTDVGTQEVTATVSGDNYETLVLTADLTITPANVTGITLKDSSFVYDGTAKSLTIDGTLPEGTTVSYTDNSRTDVGTQEVTATITGNNHETLVLTADLTITPATITGITLKDSSFVYDGTARSLTIDGTLPGGATVNYADNSRTDVGTQEVTATISGDNYETLVLTADLTITPATITGITLKDSSFVYDGTARSLTIDGTLPEGTSVSYADNSRTDVGTQEVTATVSGDNYDDLVLTANLTITPANVTGITLKDSSFVYDGTARSLTIDGTLPEGTSVSYADNSRTDVGTQEVTATVSGDNYDDLVLTANLTVTPAARTISFPALPEKAYGDADFAAGATASSGEATAYTSSDASVVEITTDGQLRITGVGEATITATVPENSNYSNRPQASQTLVVRKASQTITFTAPAEVDRGAGTIQLHVSASSGLPVTLSIDDEEVATLSGTALNILRLGTVHITATQAGDANHEPAEPVTVTVRVADPTLDLPIRVHKAVSPNGDGINEYLIIEAIKDYPENRVRIVNRNGTVVWEASGYNNGTVAFRGIGTGQNRVPAGTYFYIAEIKVGSEWKYEKGWFVLRY